MTASSTWLLITTSLTALALSPIAAGADEYRAVADSNEPDPADWGQRRCASALYGGPVTIDGSLGGSIFLGYLFYKGDADNKAASAFGATANLVLRFRTFRAHCRDISATPTASERVLRPTGDLEWQGYLAISIGAASLNMQEVSGTDLGNLTGFTVYLGHDFDFTNYISPDTSSKKLKGTLGLGGLLTFGRLNATNSTGATVPTGVTALGAIIQFSGRFE